jgi:RNA polymerase sigma factor (TIGR02999 family)
MSETTQLTVTRLLADAQNGNREALDELIPLVYDELRVLAHQQRQRWRGDYTLDTTALVHEAYLKLVNSAGISARNRGHFFALAATAIRHILCNYARRRKAKRRGGDHRIITLDPEHEPQRDENEPYAERLLALDEALGRLAHLNERQSRVVECRFFGGLTVDETAAALGISPRTVKRDWAAAQAWLQREMESLLDADNTAQDYLDVLAGKVLPFVWEAVAQESHEEVQTGQRIAQYEIMGTLGAGGMGVVYRAHDTRLDRPVALKFLPTEIAFDASARERLLYEARAASALDHPNICTVYEIGELDSGRLYLALACYAGETLKDRIARSQMSVAEVLAVARQIGKGLSAAHQRRIVHRDIKPSNLMLTREAAVKILDFGIARLRDADPVRARTAVGTVAYMSPEQTRGGAIDGRTDLWSFGVVIYEMLTGTRPFRGESDQLVIDAIRTQTATPVAQLRGDVPPLLARLVDTCLLKDPAARYQNADDLLADLRVIDSSDGGAATVRWLLVTPLTSTAGDAEHAYSAEAVTDELIGRLSHLGGLRVIARATAMALRQSGKDADAIGQDLGVEAVVSGSVARNGDQVHIALQLTDVAKSQMLWSVEQRIALNDFSGVLRTFAWQIAGELDIQARADERRQLAKQGTDNPAAYALYLKGRYFWNKRDGTSVQQARDLFQQALDLDPLFAQAWAGLADCYSILGSYAVIPQEEAYPRARSAAERALSIDDDVAEAHASLATTLTDHYRDWEAADRHYRRALALNPSYATAHLWYAGYQRDLGRFAEALEHVRIARELDPLSLPIQLAQGITLYLARRYGEAAAVYRKLLDITPDFAYAYFPLALVFVQQRRYEEALAALRRSEGWGAATPDVICLQGYVYGVLARNVEAEAMLAKLNDPAKEPNASPFHRAVIHMALGRVDDAIEHLHQAIRVRSKQIRLLRVEPLFDAIRPDPRFQALLEQIHLSDQDVFSLGLNRCSPAV